MTPPRLDGIFAVKLPVRDLAASRAWYERVFDLRLLREFPDDDGVVRGVAYEVPGLPGTGIALRERPDIAGLSGFDPVIYGVADDAAVDAWMRRLDGLGISHTVRPGTIGRVVVFHDPDGLEIHLYSRRHDARDADSPLAYRTAGSGRPLLLVHGGAEDADLLTPQAEAFAAQGHRVIWYDRRGTGASTRDGWPGGGVAQHADDAADLLRTLDAAPATVLGFSSGGVIALALAARHPDLVVEAIAWEPPALGMLPGGLALHAEIMAPLEAHLDAHPDDWAGAFAAFLDLSSGGAADLSAPVVRQMMRNAEAMLRDDARLITRHEFAPGELPAERVTVAIGKGSEPLHSSIADRLADLLGKPTFVVDDADEHEVYLHRPEVLATALAAD